MVSVRLPPNCHRRLGVRKGVSPDGRPFATGGSVGSWQLDADPFVHPVVAK
jgi:hypothetical protein